MKEWILENIGTILTGVFGSTSFVALLLEKNKRKIEEKQLGADALTKMQEGYDKFTSDLLNRYDELKNEITELKKDLVEVTEELEHEKSNYKKLKIAYDTLKEEFENYRNKLKNI